MNGVPTTSETKPDRTKMVFWLLLTAGAVLRLARLGTLPPALFRDEAEKAVTAFCILKTGRDVGGHFLPLFVNVYGVTTSAIYQYCAIPFMAVFGMNEWTTRLPAVCAGIATIMVNYSLMRRERNVSIALWATFFLALSPWHIIFSRWAQQGIFLPLLLSIAALGLRRFLDGCRIGLSAAAVSLGIALYAYEVARVFVPLLGLWVAVLHFRELRTHWKQTLLSLGLFILFSLPTIILIATQTAEAQARFNKISIFQPGSSPAQIAAQFLSNYSRHFSPSFLLLHGDAELRHSAGTGMLTGLELISLIMGVITLLNRREKRDWFWLGWLILFPVAASLTQIGIPHALRCIVAIPVIQNIAAIGIESSLARIKGARFTQARVAAYLAGIVTFLPFGYSYFVTYSARSAFNWQYGVKQSLTLIEPFEDKIEHIVFYKVVGAEYLTAFYTAMPPQNLQRSRYQGTKYTFAPFDAPLDQLYADAKSANVYLTLPGVPPPSGARVIPIDAPGGNTGDPVAMIYISDELFHRITEAGKSNQ